MGGMGRGCIKENGCWEGQGGFLEVEGWAFPLTLLCQWYTPISENVDLVQCEKTTHLCDFVVSTAPPPPPPPFFSFNLWPTVF